MIAAVLFDLDNTLIDDSGSASRAIAATCADVAAMAPGIPDAALGEAYERISNDVWNRVDLSRRKGGRPAVTGLQFRRQCWRKALRTVGVTDASVVARTVARYIYWRERYLVLFPETEAVIAVLRGRMKLAIVTNGTADTHRRKIQLLGLDQVFDYCAVAGELGLMKPDPALFLHTSERLGVPPSACLVIGDSLESDVGGAKAAGMLAVWLNRDCRPLEAGLPRPDLVIPDLRELLTAMNLEETAR